MSPENLKELKILLREKDCPFFSDDELEFYLNKNNGDIKKTAYFCLVLKSEDTTLSVSGLNCPDTSKYFRRLASNYRPNNTGVLR